MNSDLPCPACGFLTCEEIYGHYTICEVCGWEDDGVQLANPCSNGGANAKSLAEAQFFALKMYPLSVEITQGIKRSAEWRPLTDQEIENYNVKKAKNHWPNKAVLHETEAYWNTNS